MPYYRWRGINLTASYCSGQLFAQNEQELERLLLSKDIALTQIKRSRLQLPTPISSTDMIDFFKQLTVLLQSGILLPQALTIVAEQTAHMRLQKVFFEIAVAVHKGIQLSEALQQSSYFSMVMVHMMQVGERSGCVASAMEALVVHLEMAQNFKKKIRAAAMMPTITLIAFLLIAVGMIVGIVPRFAQLFNSMGKQLPEITQYLIRVSDFLQTPILWAGIATFVTALIVISYLLKKRLKPYKDAIVLRVPIVQRIVQDSALLYWLHALNMLLKSKVPLVPALQVVNPLVTNESLRESLSSIADAVAGGIPLRFAMVSVVNQPFSPDVLALIQVGQESGKLDLMVGRAAQVYHKKVEGVLRLCTIVIQPLLLICMGLLVAFLVFALYMPIFNLAQIG